MGYDIHITRKAHWAARGEPRIGLNEWLAIIQDDPQLVKTPRYDEGSGEVHMLSLDDVYVNCFTYYDGQVSVKNPTREIILKMVDIAKSLNACVMGDDEEIYQVDGTPDRPASYIPVGERE